jgi:hypothetical protein
MNITKEQEVMRNEFTVLQMDFAQMDERFEFLRAKAISLKDWKFVEIIERYWPPFYLNPILQLPMQIQKTEDI